MRMHNPHSSNPDQSYICQSHDNQDGKEMKALERKSIIRKVARTEWAAPLVIFLQDDGAQIILQSYN